MDGMQQQRVLADGWGQQASGSVFCADSSLRYIYESNSAQSLSPQQHQQALAYASGKPQPQPYNYPKPHTGTTSTHTGTPMTFAGKRPRDFAAESGVDLFEAEVARACTAIRKQAGALPPSFLECSVCLSANAQAQIQACGHTFHPSCFLRWFRLNRSCPLCRGAVDKVQLAPPADELEAIMAEMDDELLAAPRAADVQALDDPLLANSDQLMSFLGEDFDADMELAALDDAGFGLDMKQEATAMDMELDELVDGGDHRPQDVANTYSGGLAPQQFPAASAMPNYWNVLNQGLAPPVMPPAPAVPPVRMVHIAPKPDAQQAASPAAAAAVRTSEPAFKVPVPPQHSHHHPHLQAVRASPPVAPRVVSCRCTGGCRNGRCACVKEGGMCGASCRCTSCKNPFLMVKAAGADIDALLQDDCFMHNVSKTRDMVQRLQEPVAVPCCDATIKVVDCVQGYACAPCKRRYDFSWCMNKLLDSERTPRNHCAICKRCCDHRDVHCHDCGRCYFAGVAASLPCPCKEASSHKKRREAAAKDKAEEAEEEAEGECCIM
ncbi:RING-H2 finger protein ATL81 [Phytophthora cinnamomi]|uniref:RING-H2 finger protein ATL81 n=1 Tax=Phytophthora cinnamomi TaxID=4785 RepID=UPI00355A0B9E|nr:RING-H2 finger protein ATL81 [Phytophthora cinnamomi]